MKKKIIETLTNFIIEHKQSNETDIKIYKYGLEALYNLATKTIVMIIITYFTNSVKELLLLILAYTFLRLFSYGLHASSGIACWLITLPLYIISSILIKQIIINRNCIIIIWAIYFIFVLLWAPADTKKRPLIREKRRKLLKTESSVICIIYLFLIIFLNNNVFLNAICFAMILEGICICPLTYKITHNQFNNYLYYKGSLN